MSGIYTGPNGEKLHGDGKPVNDLISEMTRIAKAFKAPDQALELDIQKIINALRSHGKVPEADIMDLDDAMHYPEKLAWAVIPNPPDADKIVPGYDEIDFIKTLIDKAAEGMEWTVPSTGQVYKISPKEKTFTLIRNTQNDEHDWHSKTRAILGLIGWR